MGTASTMNALAEALGMTLPGCAAIPAPYRERGQMAYETGRRAVEMVWEDLKPSDIMTRQALENAIVVNSARSAAPPTRPSTSTPSPAMSACRWRSSEWETIGHKIPLLVNMQPAGKYLGRGVPPGRRRTGGGLRN